MGSNEIHPWNEIMTKNKLIGRCAGVDLVWWAPEETGTEAARRRSGTQTDERMTGAEKHRWPGTTGRQALIPGPSGLRAEPHRKITFAHGDNSTQAQL